MSDAAVRELKFRDTRRAAALSQALERTVREVGRAPVSVMHVCGSHEQAIARFGLRSGFPHDLHVIMGPGCPVCITDQPEVDEAVALARQGVRVATYGDMLRVPGSAASLADTQAEGARVDVVYSIAQAIALAKASDEPFVFFASGFAPRPGEARAGGPGVEVSNSIDQAIAWAKASDEPFVFFASGFETTAVATAAAA